MGTHAGFFLPGFLWEIPAARQRCLEIWASGASAKTNAEMMSVEFERHITRNAVIGFLHRAKENKQINERESGHEVRHPGFLIRTPGGKKREKKKPLIKLGRPHGGKRVRSPRPAGPRYAHTGPSFQIENAPDRESLVSIFKLNALHCRWPYGEGASALYCGKVSRPDSSYCEHHYDIAHRQEWENDARADCTSNGTPTLGVQGQDGLAQGSQGNEVIASDSSEALRPGGV